MPLTVSIDQLESYRSEGYAVLPSVLSPEELDMLRLECAYFVGFTDGWLIERGISVFGITHLGKRYFISSRYRYSQTLWTFLFGKLMQQVTTAFLGPQVYLFNEQWVVKGAREGMQFSWHQDSGYVKFRDPKTQHDPYLTCWIALDDMSSENGTISVLPHSTLGTQSRIIDHKVEAGSNDLIGYEGDEPGVQIDVPAGSIAVFSSTNLHRSNANYTDSPRRAYLAQYTAKPLYTQTGELWNQAVPFVKDGELIYDEEADLSEVRNKIQAKQKIGFTSKSRPQSD